MGKRQSRAIDPYIQFLLDTAKYADITEAAESTGIHRDNLYSMAHRGVHRLDTMIELAHQFNVDIELVAAWISNYVLTRSSEQVLTEIAS